MSHPIARRAGLLALTAAMLMPSAGALSDVSNWAQEGVAAAQNAGLAPSSLANSAASGSITRAEFCAVALNAYKAVSGKAVYVSGKKPFADCSDPNVTAAYLLGIVKGRTNGNFDPDAKISREEMCTMLDNILTAADIEATEIAGDAGGIVPGQGHLAGFFHTAVRRDRGLRRSAVPGEESLFRGDQGDVFGNLPAEK